MKLSDELSWRGLIKDKTFEDNSWLDSPRTFYHGVDASSNSMTIGNLAAMLLARRFMEAGWKAVLLAGGATSLVGDPGGKTEERTLKSREEIQNNVASIKKQINGLFAGKDFVLVDNYDWFKEVGYLEFLREIGKHYSMTELMQRDFVADRMGEGGSGISYAEFSYSLIQGYDFWQLYKNHQAVLQIGGSDQWGNMLSGVPLIRKKENAEVHAMSMPLVIDKTTGRKFGKSEAGAIWLDSAKTTPTQFYQFWINCDDQAVEDHLKMYTFLAKDQIESLMAEHRARPNERLAQQRLAGEVTDIVHGSELRQFAEQVTKYLVGELPINQADDSAFREVKNALPSAIVQPGTPLIEVLVSTGLAPSNSEARRLVQGKAVYIDGRQPDKDHLEAADFKNGRLMLRRGKAYKDSAVLELNKK